MKYPALCFSWLVLAGTAVFADDVTTQDIIKLAKAGVRDEIIVKFLQCKGAKIDLSASDIVELKSAGVGEVVIRHLLDARTQPPPRAVESIRPARTEVLVSEAPPYVERECPSVPYYAPAYRYTYSSPHYSYVPSYQHHYYSGHYGHYSYQGGHHRSQYGGHYGGGHHGGHH